MDSSESELSLNNNVLSSQSKSTDINLNDNYITHDKLEKKLKSNTSTSSTTLSIINNTSNTSKQQKSRIKVRVKFPRAFLTREKRSLHDARLKLNSLFFASEADVDQKILGIALDLLEYVYPIIEWKPNRIVTQSFKKGVVYAICRTKKDANGSIYVGYSWSPYLRAIEHNDPEQPHEAVVLITGDEALNLLENIAKEKGRNFIDEIISLDLLS